MKITLIQPVVQWRNAAANIEEAERLMEQTPGSDIYILPEMWATGFDVCPNAMTRAASREALDWMFRQAEIRQCAVAGSLAVDESFGGVEESAPAGWRNRFFFVKPGGKADFYDKMHLFTLSEEPLSYIAGERPVVTEWCGVHFRLQVCFDLRFPEAARREPKLPYEVLINVAAWPASRQGERNILLRARAIENQAVAIGVNYAGCCGKLQYPGHSSAVGPNGQTLVEAGEEAGCVSFEPPVSAVQLLRHQFPLDF